MVLGTSELIKMAENNITNLNQCNIRGASIDLSLSEEVKVIKRTGEINLFDMDIDTKEFEENLESMYDKINLAQGYALEPNSYMLASTCEEVTIPENCCAIILSRSSLARLGIILPLSCYANPGYKGFLPIIIFNASPCNVKIPPYMRIAQALIMEVRGNVIKYDEFEDSKYYNEKKLQTPSFKDKEIKEILAKFR